MHKRNLLILILLFLCAYNTKKMDGKENKMIRGKNFTNSEKQELIEKIYPYRNIIENKETNTTSNKEKDEAWADITKNFNMNKPAFLERTEKKLRNCWDNMKRDTRKYCAMLRRETYKTGGGLPNIKKEPLFEQVENIMSRAAVSGLHNPYDCDSIADSPTDKDVILVQDILQDDVSSDPSNASNPAEVFLYLLQNKGVKDWESCNIKNLRSERSSPLKINAPSTSKQVGYKQRKYDENNELDEAKVDLTNTLKASIETKNNYEVEILKTKLEKEQLKVELLKILVEKKNSNNCAAINT
ncbi:uncharacterized protein [Temnothorax longispinosus]|uniref:uncharacterized protein n=1 Tax=Temnothorax longispinosus TaxID=300112 RepID=UPI003A990C89